MNKTNRKQQYEKGWKQSRTIARKARCCAYIAKQNRKKAELSEVGTYNESEALEAGKWKQDRTIAREARCCAFFCKAKPKESGAFWGWDVKRKRSFRGLEVKARSSAKRALFAKQNQKKASFLSQEFSLTNSDLFKVKILFFLSSRAIILNA